MQQVDAVALVTYETQFSPCGGIAAVMKFLPRSLQETSGMRTIVISPYHHRVPRMKSLLGEMVLRGVVSVPWKNGVVMVHILSYPFPDVDVEWIFLLPDHPDFFSGKRHPYDVEGESEFGGSRLLWDSLVFGVAAAKALHVLGPGLRWSVLMQDWEAATVALALAERPYAHALHLTLHNSYDSGVVRDGWLEQVGIASSRCRGNRPHATVLERVLPLLQKPMFTVSEGFALDLVEDPLQRDVMAPHLQQRFVVDGRLQLVGIDNGPFADTTIPARNETSSSKKGFDSAFHRWKSERRTSFCEALERLEEKQSSAGPGGHFGMSHWGDIRAFLERQRASSATRPRPWLVMGGRDDPRQKGYDVAAFVAREALSAGTEADFLFFPIPGDEGLAGLRFLADLAWDFPSQVLVFPFVFRDGYFAALQGATYGLMPSFYEPFGAANEFYANGTPGIARATGGLAQQIVPLREVEGLSGWHSMTPAVRRRAERWHAREALPTGILYREPDALPSTVSDWHAINAANYRNANGIFDRVGQRQHLAVWRAMASSLANAMEDALVLFQTKPELYEQLLYDGHAHIQQRFSWEQSAIGYLRCIAPHTLR